MKHLKAFEKILSERDMFVRYILSFYGPNGTWSEFFDHKLTQKTVEDNVDKFIKKRGKDFDGNSFDRELYRDILLVKTGILGVDSTETNVRPYFTKSELKKAELLHKSNKYNL